MAYDRSPVALDVTELQSVPTAWPSPFVCRRRGSVPRPPLDRCRGLRTGVVPPPAGETTGWVWTEDNGLGYVTAAFTQSYHGYDGVPVSPYVGWTYDCPKCGGIVTVYRSAHVCDTHCGRTCGVDPDYTVEVLREMYTWYV